MATEKKKIRGYGVGSVDTVISVEDVANQASALAENAPTREDLLQLVDGKPFIDIRALVAGYGKMEILHGLDLVVGEGQSLCLIGPNGAGKSTVLHSIYGFTNIMSGYIYKQGTDITQMSANQKLARARVAYILQDNSVFPEMTVTENLLMGGF